MGQDNVPLLTSFYVQLSAGNAGATDEVLPDSVSLVLTPAGRPPVEILQSGRRFGPGYSGRLFPGKSRKSGRTLEVYVDSTVRLEPATRYRIRVQARSCEGAELAEKAGTWRFTTEAAPETHPVSFDLSLDSPPVTWHGAFFSGFCKPCFCTSDPNRISSYELMDQARQSAPKAWSLQRDFTLTGMDTGPKPLPMHWPSIVRERETRRIAAINTAQDDALLHVEDFFGHQQYGIQSKRPIGDDYHPGDEVLIADPSNSARAKVISVDEQRRTVRVTGFDTPDGGWKLDYTAPLPTKENPHAPGLFPPGGCYLHKFNPSGTPTYYWRRLQGFARRDTEFVLQSKLLVPLRENLFLTFDVMYDNNESNFETLPLNNQYSHFTFDMGLEYRFPNSWTRRSLEIR